MIKLISLTSTVLISPLALANSFSCYAQKSLMTYNTETEKLEIKRATTGPFHVTEDEHEDPKTFDLKDESGEPWGSVQVSTGSHLVDKEKWFHANATVTKYDGSIIGFLILKMPVTATSGVSSTLIFDDSEEMPPSLTLACAREPQKNRWPRTHS